MGAYIKSQRDGRPQTGAQAPGKGTTKEKAPRGRQKQMQVEIKQVTCSVAPSGPDWYADVSSAAVVASETVANPRPDWYADVSSAAVVAERKRITLSSLFSFYLIVVRGKASEVR